MSQKLPFSLPFEKIEAFIQFKNRVNNNYGPDAADDFQIYRFLKARDFDAKQAEIMYDNHLDWRKKYRIDTILNDFKMCEAQRKYFQLNMLGFDKEGSPVFHLNFGRLDMKGVVKSIRKCDILRYLAYFFTNVEELMKQQSRKLNRPIETWNAILDFENFSLMQAIHKPSIDVLLECFSMYEKSYPERLKAGFAINVSTPFYLAFNLIKPVLSAATLEKVKIFGKNGWKEELLQIVDPEVLPAFLGGRRTDPDGNPLCLTTVHHAGIVPEHYYFRSSERRLCGQPGVKTYYLNRMGKANILFDITDPGSSIEWQFETENNDIGFGLFYRGKDDNELNLKPLIRTHRVNAHMQTETGIFLCKKTGIYVLTLDNSHSWLRQKQIFCKTAVKSPNEQQNVIT